MKTNLMPRVLAVLIVAGQRAVEAADRCPEQSRADQSGYRQCGQRKGTVLCLRLLRLPRLQR